MALVLAARSGASATQNNLPSLRFHIIREHEGEATTVQTQG
jgi:hypothetical protein